MEFNGIAKTIQNKLSMTENEYNTASKIMERIKKTERRIEDMIHQEIKKQLKK